MDATDARLAKFASIDDKKRRTYAAMMSALDDNIGRVRQALKESGQEGRTLIFFISDNGGPVMTGTTTNGSSNAPLRGSKRTTLEGGIRVPFLVAWPDQLKPAVYDPPVVQLDLHATALAAAGVAVGPEAKLEGVDLLPYFSGTKKAAPHDALYWRFGAQMAIRQGDWKLVRYDGNADTNTGKAQPVSALKLYNLSKDIHEDKDLTAEQPEKVKLLQALWDEWNRSNIKPLWGADYADNDGAEPGAAKKKKAAK
jgi:arylsulfatase A-like enzyme